jgi:hypothetical protein
MAFRIQTEDMRGVVPEGTLTLRASGEVARGPEGPRVHVSASISGIIGTMGRGCFFPAETVLRFAEELRDVAQTVIDDAKAKRP